MSKLITALEWGVRHALVLLCSWKHRQQRVVPLYTTSDMETQHSSTDESTDICAGTTVLACSGRYFSAAREKTSRFMIRCDVLELLPSSCLLEQRVQKQRFHLCSIFPNSFNHLRLVTVNPRSVWWGRKTISMDVI